MEKGLDPITCWSRKKNVYKRKPSKKLQSKKKLPFLNGYPKNIAIATIKLVLSKETLANDVISNKEKHKIATVFINKDYLGEKGEQLLKKFFKKLGHSTNLKINFLCRYSVTKLSFFTKIKDKLSKLSKSNIVYQFSYSTS